ncbi:MAG TPA: exodeoxyribonuclease V subunit gamma [Kiritimatiellia bacterium]|nr:exodeoxyribonuclease V subunit gamma [Kiritimatiellia bacterium]HMO99169.1 exodeoxyribonuclease V subunit gamma [Kiritimatiellia bacterium]HMP95756.1 exodeoxyribonuclease V subunit gamma [Kiritimatiellia bacterium]
MKRLNLHSSSSPRALLERAAEVLCVSGEAEDPLAVRWVVQPGRLWERALRRRMADNGIAAGLVFGSLRLTLERAFRLAAPDAPLSDEQDLYLRLADLLLHHHDRLEAIGLSEDSAPARWMQRNREDPSLACLKLARMLAVILDDHATHRPRDVLRWLGGEAPTRGDEAWIAALARVLWRKTGNPRPLALWLGGWDRRVRRAAETGAGLPSTVLAVLTGAQPLIFLEALGALALWCPVHVLVMETCERGRSEQMTTWREVRRRWKDAGGGEPLRDFVARANWWLPASLQAYWGAAGIALQQELVDVEESVGALEVEVIEAPPPVAPRLPPGALGVLRDDVRTARAERTEADRPAIDPADRSLALIDATSPLRELEGARDAIRDALEREPGLVPSDVLIILSDTTRYAPLLPAVFGPAASGAATYGPDGRPAIPWHLADRSLRADSDAVAAMMTLLDACSGRLTLPLLARVLAQPAVQARLAFSAEESAEMVEALHDAGFRWGVDQTERATAHQPGGDDGRWTLDFALRRLTAGFVQPDAQYDPVGKPPGVTPQPGFEGIASASLARLLLWVEDLAAARAAFQSPRPLSVRDGDTDCWVYWLRRWLPRLMQTGGERERQAVWLTRMVNTLEACGEHLDAGHRFSPDAFRRLLDDAAAEVEVSLPIGQGGGGMTVASPRMARALPAAVVVVVGLADGAWPRAEASRPRGLLATYRPGDRMRRDDDRLITLEWLLAAERALIWTWPGRDPHTGEAVPPSVVVDELRDIADKTFAPGTRREQRLPMHGFDPRAFTGAFPSPDAVAFRAARALARQRVIRSSTEQPPLTLAPPLADDPMTARWRGFVRDPVSAAVWDAEAWTGFGRAIIDFWESPAKAFLRARGILAPETFNALPEREALALDGLARWELRDTFLRGLVSGVPADADRLTRRWERAGALPPRGEDAVAIARDEAQAIWDKASGLDAGDGVRLLLSDPRVPDAAHGIWLTPGSLSAKALMKARMLQVLACVATGRAVSATLISHARYPKAASLPEPEAPVDRLRVLAAWMLVGRRAALPFFPEASRAWVEQGEDAARELFWEGTFGGTPEAQAPHVWLAFRSVDPFAVRLPAFDAADPDAFARDLALGATNEDAPLFGVLAEMVLGFLEAMLPAAEKRGAS